MGAVLSAAVAAVVVVVATANRLRWPKGVVGTAATGTVWLVALVTYRTLR